MLKLMYDALTIAGKHITSNIACVHSQQKTNDSVLLLAHMTLCFTTLGNFQTKPHLRWCAEWVVNTYVNYSIVSIQCNLAILCYSDVKPNQCVCATLTTLK